MGDLRQMPHFPQLKSSSKSDHPASEYEKFESKTLPVDMVFLLHDQLKAIACGRFYAMQLFYAANIRSKKSIVY